MFRTARAVVVLIICIAVFIVASPAAAQDGDLAYGDTVTGAIDDAAPEHIYVFTAQAGDVVSIALTATSGDLDPLLILTDASGVIITQDDDSGEGRNAFITYTVGAAGAYRVIATRYDRAQGDTSGDYELTLIAQSAGGAPAEGSVDAFGELPDLGEFSYEMIAYGDTVSGAVADEAVARAYAFQGRAGETITLTTRRTSGNLALRVALFDRTGQTTLAEAEDSANAGEAAITYILPETAYYVIGVGRVDGDGETTAGEFELTLGIVAAETPTPAPTLAPAATPEATAPAIDITLTWNTIADIDLILYYPSSGEGAASIDWRNIAYPEEYPLPAGVVFAADGNGFCQNLTDRPNERITWEVESAPVGNYEILVQYQFSCFGPEAPVDFEITLTVDGQMQTISGAVNAPKGEYRATFAR